MDVSRRRAAPVLLAGGILAGATLLAACGFGSPGATAPTSTVPSTAFRTIPVTPPKPTAPPTTAPAGGAGGATGSSVPTGPAPSIDPNVRTVYTVKAGDAPASIARRFDVTLDALLAANGMDPKKPAVYVGQKLKIPRVLPPTTVLPTGEKAYVVEPNDSLLAIANKFGIPVQQILDLNGLQLTSNIAPGQLIKIPG